MMMLLTLDIAKASQQSDIPTKFLKQNSDCFAEYFDGNINHCISKSIFLSDLKSADVSPVYKKKLKKSTADQLASYPIFLKLTKDISLIRFSSFSILVQISIRVSYSEFHKGKIFDLRCSIFSYAICFTFLEIFVIDNYADNSTSYCACEFLSIKNEFAVNYLEQSSTTL